MRDGTDHGSRKPSKAIETHQPCPHCGSSDAFATYDDGHSYCYACATYFKPDGEELLSRPDNATYEYHPHRGISKSTFEYYNVTTEFVDDVPRRIAFVYPNKAIKWRAYDKKEFNSEGPMSDAGCFGVNRFDPGSKDTITLTEGEYDALAVYDITRGATAAISVRSASSAKRDCTRDYDYINSFGRIILAFDGDEPGISAARAVSSLFDFNKVYHVKLNRFKDANDYLVNGAQDDFYNAWKNAKRYAPDNIISTFLEFEQSLVETDEALLATYPFPTLQNRLYGLHSGEVVVFKGDEGIGKTEIFRAIEHHILKETKCNIGIIHLEEDNGTTIKALAGYELQAPAVVPDSGVSNTDVIKAIKKLVKNDETRIHIHSSFDVEDENAIIDNIRFLVSAADCRIIFLDHISWLATGQDDEDERKKLDRLSQKFKLLAKELGCCICMISHVNDSGKTRGSRNITKVANTVIDLRRDITSNDETERNSTYLTIEKARLGGNTGPAGVLLFDRETFMLKEREHPQAIKVPNLA